ncbi:uncharacterized protein LOC130940765 isoform X1 [Arachis stenosperma]|uniref:uncharacterized protein LOC130940765 isoform X1 n=2 Tax=Arachis stenosperma TaxID=217475 RepID=UPI0025AD64DE|nr:uncharacterized protein LOC130940765 isoform X1 [Arachis stenosperma]
MATSFSYWDDCVNHRDLEAMWRVPEVKAEWLKAGEVKGQKVHLSRDPDGQPYLTQTEMRAVTDIIIRRNFPSQIDPRMVCAIAELESDRQLLVMRTTPNSKELTVGLMQILPKTAHWLMSDLGYGAYGIEGSQALLFQPFTNVYFGAAYIRWLSNFEDIARSEEFIVRAYKGGTKRVTHKSTLQFWKSYLLAKESFPSRNSFDERRSEFRSGLSQAHSRTGSVGSFVLLSDISKETSGDTYWDSRVSPENMEDMWNHPVVRKEWIKSKQEPGKVLMARDEKNRPYLSRAELKAVADIILFKYLQTKKMKSTILCAISEVVSMRFLHGVGERPGIMGISYSTAYWIYMQLGYRAYKLESPEDLYNPFVSMYFGAAYVTWLSEYEERERTPEFVVQAYCVGPQNVNPQDTNTLWLKFEEALSSYEDGKGNNDSCSIM